MSKRTGRRLKKKYIACIEALKTRLVLLEKKAGTAAQSAQIIVPIDKKPREEPKPKGWASDPLTNFIEQAHRNTHATFHNKKPFVGQMVAVDRVFEEIGTGLTNPKDVFGALLIPRCHSAFRASCNLAMSGYATDAFPAMRSCLEFALYAYHIHFHPEHGDLWLDRHVDEESFKASKKAFRHVAVIQTLNDREPKLCAIVEELYSRTIDYGGHPNERSVSGSLKIEQSKGRTELQGIYLHGDSYALEHVLKSSAQIGLTSLYLFRRIFKERFDLLGLTERIDALRSEL